MSKNLLASVVAVGLLAGPMAANAAIYNPGTGTWYEFVTGAVNWSTAQTAAGSSFGGTGYLVNITSAAENAFILANMPTSWEGAWTGGREDINTENLFSWDSGPEANQTVAYTNWDTSEPNNNLCCSLGGPAGEDRIQILGWSNNSSPGTWNDLAQAGTLWHMSGYIVEAPVPLPAAAWLLLSGPRRIWIRGAAANRGLAVVSRRASQEPRFGGVSFFSREACGQAYSRPSVSSRPNTCLTSYSTCLRRPRRRTAFTPILRKASCGTAMTIAS